jgi:hypothetical protein
MEETMPKAVSFVRHIVLGSAALASLAVVAAPIQEALGDKPSTPVTVVNPSTGPALTSSIDDPGRIAYQSVATLNSSGSHCAATSCNFSFAAVPQGQRLVVQHVSGLLYFNGTPDAVTVQLGNGSGFFAPFVDNESLFDQPVLYYVDGGTSPVVNVSLLVPVSQSGGAGTSKDMFTADPQSVTLTGYLLNCTVSPCAAIAQ